MVVAFPMACMTAAAPLGGTMDGLNMTAAGGGFVGSFGLLLEEPLCTAGGVLEPLAAPIGAAPL
eukprot:2216950-Amphidinium_carterae.1